MSYRNWCFTLNNPIMNDGKVIAAFADYANIRYLVFQLEVGELGTPHSQGYCEFTKPVRLVALKKIIPGVHGEPRKGTRDQARAYCMKEDTRTEGPWEYGEWPLQQGKRSDVDVVIADINAGKSLADIQQDHPAIYIRLHAGIEKLIAARKPVKPVPKIYWFWGPSGTGKTREAKRNAQGEDDVLIDGTDYAFSSPPPRIFQEYKSHIKRFILDEYHPKMIPHHLLKRYIDRNPVVVNVMYGTEHFVPEEIYITCSVPPSHFWTGNPLREIERRCTEIREFK
ncbi:replication-associated protein [Sewage-associated circular DNA molecule]|uniref:Replication-associated protein n=1 Tax=Sewage-associated circular DNA molecule TaxID=1592207 RepID=A0A0B4UG03_9VIRU|nr:replication-associated protein [Sewage-associated circular DNA molecule]AJD07567.1 replication-associated protein [Sewage-associated circular DNA molecule]